MSKQRTELILYILHVVHQHSMQARSHGGARGGWAPPGKIWAPPSRPRLPALTFYRYRYWGLFPPPLEFCQPPLLTIPGYGADSMVIKIVFRKLENCHYPLRASLPSQPYRSLNAWSGDLNSVSTGNATPTLLLCQHVQQTSRSGITQPKCQI